MDQAPKVESSEFSVEVENFRKLGESLRRIKLDNLSASRAAMTKGLSEDEIETLRGLDHILFLDKQ